MSRLCSRLTKQARSRRAVSLIPCRLGSHTSANIQDNESLEMPELRLGTSQMPRLTDIGSRNIFTQEQDTFRESARRFLQAVVAPQQAAFEEAGQPSREVYRAMGEMGILGVCIPAEHGGIGGSFLDEMIVTEELGYSFCYAPNIGMHSTIAMPYLSHYGTQQQQAQYLPSMVSGECIASLAITEPGAGSDMQGVKTTAKRAGDDWIINGSKIYITNGWTTDCCIVVARTKTDGKAAHGLSLFLVDADRPGFHRGTKLRKLGLRGQDTAELFFDDLRVPHSALLGTENHGFYYLMNQLPQERVCVANEGLSRAEAMFELTRDWVRQRKAFGKRVADLQTVQHKLAELKTSLAVCRAFLDQCMALHSVGRLDNEMASMAKYWATDLENKVSGDCLQLHGGWGFMWETQIAKCYANSRVTTIYAGTNEIMKELIARNIVRD